MFLLSIKKSRWIHQIRSCQDRPFFVSVKQIISFDTNISRNSGYFIFDINPHTFSDTIFKQQVALTPALFGTSLVPSFSLFAVALTWSSTLTSFTSLYVRPSSHLCLNACYLQNMSPVWRTELSHCRWGWGAGGTHTSVEQWAATVEDDFGGRDFTLDGREGCCEGGPWETDQ